MSDQSLRESLSALVDGELEPEAADRVLDAVLADPSLREQWRRHHLVCAVLSGHRDGIEGVDALASRVRDALASEPAPMASRGPTRKHRWRPLALAGSVAAFTVVVGFVLGDARQAAPPPVADAGPAVPRQAEVRDGAAVEVAAMRSAAPRTGAERARMTWNDTRPAVEARLNGYLLNHNEYLSGGVRGMLPYARVVGYDARD